MSKRHPVAVLGGTGYVAGEFLRLLAGHPGLELVAASSESRAGAPIAATFPNLAGAFPAATFCDEAALEQAVGDGRVRALFCAAPHGAAAGRIDTLLRVAAAAGAELSVVDASADFRFRDPAAYARVYGHPHACPERLAEFAAAVPEHVAGLPAKHIGHPGCFVTSVLLGIVPLLRAGLAEPEFFVSAVTGSTGAGRKLGEGTHHPVRHSNMFAYQPLTHRHRPEIEQLAAEAAAPCQVHFVPHSGPWARGIHATVHGRLAGPATAAALREALAAAYAGSPFVEVIDTPPRIKDVAGSNRARLSVAAEGEAFVVMSAIDNLVKGAAGGAMQWLNRLLDLPEDAGLRLPGPAWI
ncbi:N-acetyl-gamma-glutamyl-phosphate reductase [Thioalkalivibrio sp. XN8]|uniref:N-acetyl-gamma-glutamyl-phosphate reductase n=1 Tax=Thioalkalivibrio sp. XN8 TaxID=2712863 RepID=UPI0013EAABD5|nr:N-acetyl-gamma-glutamyl-phosphate reductase [Thioalkalivibrio sp. XN8]NGP52550.1 N-acetyl-gamma-glutamyl-phosphate reductase [Thioalkalivibrio sp. XN8]